MKSPALCLVHRGPASPRQVCGIGRSVAAYPRPGPPARQPDQWLQRLCRHVFSLQKGRRNRQAPFHSSGLARSPYFSDAERAALALSEAVTRLSDRANPVPDEVWNEAARHYDEPALAALILWIAMTNVWNRLTSLPGRWQASGQSPHKHRMGRENAPPERHGAAY
jgi:hypothetical protein